MEPQMDTLDFQTHTRAKGWGRTKTSAREKAKYRC